MRKRKPLIVRFYLKVRRTSGCWTWTGSKCSNGYGQIYVNGRLQQAHRVAWELANGPIPPGFWVLHRCDNRACVLVAHLFLGDRAANTADMLAKGRSVRGERNGRSRLTPNDVAEVKRLRSCGYTQQAIADQLGMAQPTVSEILGGKRWRHLQDGKVEVRQ